ncbi:MAG: hypothetical protein JO299_04040 [Gammaproteobacteria bacterium]|nr:hypothetical protein [Gammaproteobacteria bacterium]
MSSSRKKSATGVGGSTDIGSPTHVTKKQRRRTGSVDPRAQFLGTRPLHLGMRLRGKDVLVELRPLVHTTEVVNYKITIRCGRKVLRWTPTHAELALIGRAAGMETKQETSQ